MIYVVEIVLLERMEPKMELNGINSAVSNIETKNYAQDKTVNKTATEEKAADKVSEEGVVFEKSTEPAKKATYSINKMTPEERASFVKQLEEDIAARKQSFIDMVTQMFTGQGKTFAIANGQNSEDDLWKMLASGDFEVDEATKAQAQKDISEDGYWGIAQTSQRLFDFAMALAGDDEGKMKQMQEAMETGFKQATGTWGKDLPDISQNTLDAANKLFNDYYESKKTVTE